MYLISYAIQSDGFLSIYIFLKIGLTNASENILYKQVHGVKWLRHLGDELSGEIRDTEWQATHLQISLWLHWQREPNVTAVVSN